MTRTVASLAFLAATAAAAPHPMTAQELHYEHPAAGAVEVRTGAAVYHDETGRTLDLYRPPAPDPSTALPAVVFVLTLPDGVMEVPLKDYHQYTSWARLVAAEGMVGVLYQVGDADGDLARVLDHLSGHAAALGIDPARVALWSCSGNVPVALRAGRRGAPSPVSIRALVAYYGFMPTPDGFRGEAMDSIARLYDMAMPMHGAGESYPSDLPMLIARAGQDRWTVGLESTDHFVAWALAENLPVTVLNYPDGRHAFDVLDDTAETRRIIAATLRFMRVHLDAGSP